MNKVGDKFLVPMEIRKVDLGISFVKWKYFKKGEK